MEQDIPCVSMLDMMAAKADAKWRAMYSFDPNNESKEYREASERVLYLDYLYSMCWEDE